MFAASCLEKTSFTDWHRLQNHFRCPARRFDPMMLHSTLAVQLVTWFRAWRGGIVHLRSLWVLDLGVIYFSTSGMTKIRQKKRGGRKGGGNETENCIHKVLPTANTQQKRSETYTCTHPRIEKSSAFPLYLHQ